MDAILKNQLRVVSLALSETWSGVKFSSSGRGACVPGTAEAALDSSREKTKDPEALESQASRNYPLRPDQICQGRR